MEVKTIPFMFAKVLDDRNVEGLASVTGNVDDGFDRIFAGAFTKTIAEQGRRIKHLWQHEFWNPPIAVVKELREIKRKELPEEVRANFPDATGGLMVTRQYLPSARGDEVLTGIKAEAITEMSIGYDPIKFDFEAIDALGQKSIQVRNLREMRLFDTSDVNWGMNAATVAAKSCIPFTDSGHAEEKDVWKEPVLADFTDRQWEDLDENEKRRIAAHYTYAANMPPESFEDLKLAHHRPQKQGVGPAIWMGCAKAMNILMRGFGMDKTAELRRAAFDHLEKHYGQWGKEAPPRLFVELAVVAKALLVPDTLKVGRVLSAANVEKLTSAIGIIQEILAVAEPPAEEDPAKALTRRKQLALALQICESEFPILAR